MASHDVNYAYEWADEIFIFHEGRLLKSGSPDEIFSDDTLLKTASLKPPLILSILKNPDILKKKGKRYYSQ